MLSISHLTKKYGEKTAVDDLSLTISAGEIYGFIGHNGAGKTTTLKACCGLIDFDEGEITIGGNSIRRDPLACKRMTAYIPDNPDMYDFLTGHEYLNFVADVYGVSAAERKECMEYYGELLSVTEAFAKPISACSHGMRQKIAVISALIHKPKLIIMDEPFVGLDPSAAHKLKTVMKEHCEAGGAIFFSTHVLEVAEKLCHKIAVIKDGKLLKNGTMDEVTGDASLEEVFLELADNDA
ncbi:MAG: ABC transporter ATP-binding protein [Ruminococcaceae bacterium]|nr:ABC transporter ATP-binding protein [Oscillospiraceae bacterium]